MNYTDLKRVFDAKQKEEAEALADIKYKEAMHNLGITIINQKEVATTHDNA